jgi:REP element-mobilizing transposase RayT
MIAAAVKGMGRAWRIEFEGALYHVLSRGNERREIFYNDGDRILFLETLGEMAQRQEIEVYAYVLMTNHYHILMRTHRANLSKAMHWFGVKQIGEVFGLTGAAVGQRIVLMKSKLAADPSIQRQLAKMNYPAASCEVSK